MSIKTELTAIDTHTSKQNPVNLAELRRIHERAFADFDTVLGEHFPSADQWAWHRACAAIRGENVRRNEDQSLDAALAADLDIRAAWDAYILKLHAFYTARDGGMGFLGSRGARS